MDKCSNFCDFHEKAFKVAIAMKNSENMRSVKFMSLKNLYVAIATTYIIHSFKL